MKKIILSLILALTVIFSCVSPAFASESTAWILNENAESITHDGTTYLPVYNVKNYRFVPDESHKITLEFADEVTRERYDGGYIRTYPDTPGIIEVVINNGSIGATIFVAEDYMAEFKILQNGDGIFYQIENLYGITTTLSRYEFLNCTISSTFSSVSDNHFDWYDLFAVSDTGFCCAVGAVLKNKTTGKFYILRYCDYDSSYFYADGTFARNNRVTLYAIDDENVINDINALLNQVPEDELDWLASKDPSEIAKIVSAVIFFGVIPLAIIVFCVITLIKTKKKMYRAPLIVLMSSAVVLLISAIILYF